MYLGRHRTRVARTALGSAAEEVFNDLKRLAGMPAADLSSEPIQMGPAEIDPTPEDAPTDTSIAMANIGGVCMPTSPSALSIAKDFQRQINRALKAINAPLVGIDGKIGPETVTALQKLAQAGVIPAPFFGAGSCGDLTVISSLSAQCSAFADSKGVPASVSAPSVSGTPSYVNLATKQIVPQSSAASALDAFKNLSTIEKVSITAALGGAAYLALTMPKKRK